MTATDVDVIILLRDESALGGFDEWSACIAVESQHDSALSSDMMELLNIYYVHSC